MYEKYEACCRKMLDLTNSDGREITQIAYTYFVELDLRDYVLCDD